MSVTTGKASWDTDSQDAGGDQADAEAREHGKNILHELSKLAGYYAGRGNREAIDELIHYTGMIFHTAEKMLDELRSDGQASVH